VPPAFEVRIPARASEAAGVRRAIRAELARYGLERDHAESAQLVASELIMNAVMHGAEPVVVRLSVEQGVTVLEVYDGGDGTPVLAPDHAGHTARGLRVVAALCTDWGVVRSPDGGKTVWCALPQVDETPPPERDAPHRRAADQPPR
jgi:anti-sigma regulatory factor (Ser/Thr protein kinase)